MAAVRRPGTTLKLNLALTDCPASPACRRTRRSPFGSTIHLLPGSASLVGPAETDSPMAALRAMWADVQAGRLPAEPTIEWYLHTTVDPSLQRRRRAPLVGAVRPVGALRLAGTTWDAALPGYVDRLLGICDRYAPGTSDLVADAVPLPPPGIEEHFGITGGHIHHVDNTVVVHRPDALRHRPRRPVRRQRRLPPGRQRDRRGRPQRRPPNPHRPGR